MARVIYSSFLLICLMGLVGCQDSARTGRNLDFNQLTNQENQNEENDDVINTIFTRPDEALRISSYCGCRGANPILAGTGCEAICQSKTNAQNEQLDMLYLNVNVDPEISLNTAFVNLEGWCLNSVPGNDDQNNGVCELTVESTQTGEELASIDYQSLSNNQISFDLTGLANEQTFRLKIVERNSGAGSANSIQIRKKLFVDSPLLTLGPVGIDPINQYSCIINLNRTVANNGDTSYISSTRSFFYYSQKEIYSPLPANNRVIYCFDFINEGVKNYQDRVEYPRLETIAGAFSLWDRNDVRFKDNWAWKPTDPQTGGGANGVNGKDDIIDLIEYEVYKQTLNLNTNLNNLFNELSGFVQPEVYVDGSTNNQSSDAIYGHYLTPLSKDGVTTYCPDDSDYNATVDANPIDRALGAVLGVETEALYTAEKAQTEFYIDTNGVQQTLPSQRLYIKRTKLDQISYYFNNDMIRVEPSQENMDNQTIYFHWPPFTNYAGGSRFVQTSDQRVYRVLKPNPSGNSGIVPKDGKIGCIPKSN